MIKLYLDRNVDVQKIKEMIKSVLGDFPVEFIQWPLEGKSKRIRDYGLPAGEITWDDLNHITWDELDFCTLDDFQPTDKYEQILSVVGKQHRKDCIHFDIAIKNGCHFFLTSDKDFLQKREELQSLSQIQIFDPSNLKELEDFHLKLKEIASATSLKSE